MTTLLNSASHYKKHIPLLVSLFLVAAVVFLPVLRYSYPLGYAGMFTMIAEKISAANFALPANIPHYGPGGIDLVYPPLAMYLFALAMKLGISTWAYLRIVPAIFMLLSVIPLYYFSLEFSNSMVASLAAVILIITAPAVFYIHVWAAGVVRGLALFFCMAGLFYYVRSLRNFSWRDFIFAGICLGLLLMTHLLYVVFAALVGLACLVAEWKPSRLLTALGILVLALLISAPWLILIIERHGITALVAASTSHRNGDALLMLKEISVTAQLISDNLRYMADNWFLTALALPGFILLLVQKKLTLPLAFVLILFMGEASFYSEILAGLMAGIFIAHILQPTPKITNLRNISALVLPTLVVLCFLLAAVSGLLKILQYQPELDAYSFQTASFVRENTDPKATYFFVGKINEAEWLPYLFDRTPVFGPWGSEWKGTYAKQSEIVIAIRDCELHKDWGCLENIQKEQSVSPSLMITPDKRWLTQEIKDTHLWNLVYKDERYLVWEKNFGSK